MSSDGSGSAPVSIRVPRGQLRAHVLAVLLIASGRAVLGQLSKPISTDSQIDVKQNKYLQRQATLDAAVAVAECAPLLPLSQVASSMPSNTCPAQAMAGHVEHMPCAGNVRTTCLAGECQECLMCRTWQSMSCTGNADLSCMPHRR